MIDTEGVAWGITNTKMSKGRYVGSIKRTRREAIEEFLPPTIEDWAYFYRRGWRAVKITVRKQSNNRMVC